MDRRNFIKALLAIPAVAALPNPALAAEELLDGIMYVSRSYIDPQGAALVETWRRAGGKLWRMVTTEDAILSLTEEPYCPWVKMPDWRAPVQKINAR